MFIKNTFHSSKSRSKFDFHKFARYENLPHALYTRVTCSEIFVACFDETQSTFSAPTVYRQTRCGADLAPRLLSNDFTHDRFQNSLRRFQNGSFATFITEKYLCRVWSVLLWRGFRFRVQIWRVIAVRIFIARRLELYYTISEMS